MSSNTKISYMYRDAANYKTSNDVIIKGFLELSGIIPYFKDGEFFIPSEVGLEDLQGNEFTADDHIWHEIVSLEKTKTPSTVDFDAEVLIRSFQAACDKEWNESEVFQKKGLL